MSNDLNAFWMPFTPNRQFKERPRMVKAAKGMYYTAADDDRPILDMTAGLWCANAGHCREPIVAAIQEQAATLDYAPPFNFAQAKAFELASKVTELAGKPFSHMFFVNSGSEAVDTALKIALAYHKARGEGGRTRLIGRERGYHGVGFGGISVGGMVKNREAFGLTLPGVDHMRHTHMPDKNRFTRGEVEHGAELADNLQRMVELHGASTIAAVIVEPFAGSVGVLPPPKGYLKRLREICDTHGILLIFDEVISGFGRLGTPFAGDRFGAVPDIITCAKGLTSGTVPMGGVLVRDGIYEAFMQGPKHIPELFHGYTYSAHPLACAAGLATLQLYEDEGLIARVAGLERVWSDTVHGLKDAPYVTDIRTIGLVGAVELEASENGPGTRGFEACVKAFEEHDMMIRIAGDTIVFSPPFIISEDEMKDGAARLRRVLESL